MTRQRATPETDGDASNDGTGATNGAETGGDAAEPSPGSGDAVLHRTRPTIKPPLVWIAVTVMIGGATALAALLDPIGLLDPDLASILGMAVVFITFIAVARLVIRIYVLTRMEYVLTETSLRYEFSLWFRHRSREIPFARVRGHELSQDRIQSAFRVGTVSVLTGGTNASLGYVEFSNVPNPDRIRAIIREQSAVTSADRRAE